jgi:ABC-type sugar transport system substrate-binding protein
VRIGVFLVSSGSLYQGQQKEAAESAARAGHVELDVFFANGDSKKQREQVFSYVRGESAPAGVVVHPVEEAGLRFVAQEAVQKGIAWAVASRAPAWTESLGRDSGVLAFCVAVDQVGIGRLQGEQYRALLPEGGTVLYVTGPSMAASVQERQTGMEAAKGSLINTINVVGNWNEPSGHDAVAAWLETTRGLVPFDMIGSQNDDMGIGARKALTEAADAFGKPAWRDLPITGVDGLPAVGQRLVDAKTLTATVIMPTTAGRAVELMAQALRGGESPRTVTTLPMMSYPHLSLLKGRS